MPPKKKLPDAIDLRLQGVGDDGRCPTRETARRWRSPRNRRRKRPAVLGVPGAEEGSPAGRRFTPSMPSCKPVGQAKRLKPVRDRRQGDARFAELYLDLIGLPPTPEQVDAFVADTSPDAVLETGRRTARVAGLRRAVGPALAGRGPLRRNRPARP